MIFGLGIRMVGERTAEFLAEHFGSMDALMAGERRGAAGGERSRAAHRRQYSRVFCRGEKSRLIERLREAGLTLYGRKESARHELAGLTFVLTGTLPTYSPRRCEEDDRRRGRQGERLGEQKDQLRGGGRRSGIEARQGAVAGSEGDQRGRVAGDAGGVDSAEKTAGAKDAVRFAAIDFETASGARPAPARWALPWWKAEQIVERARVADPASVAALQPYQHSGSRHHAGDGCGCAGVRRAVAGD